MLVRLVHMYFTREGAEKFLEIFNESVQAIRRMEGCTHLELLRDIENPGHLTTLSHWDSTAHLEQYRQSPLFKNVWSRVKPLFAEKALAYSMEVRLSLGSAGSE